MKGMLSCKKLASIVKNSFSKVKETNIRTPKISLLDNLMSGYALFSLKYPSLLQFDNDCKEDQIKNNLKTVFEIKQVPSDTQIRTRLDELAPSALRRTFKSLFAQCQRSKFLDLFNFYDNRYLLPIDGTGYFYSKEVHCDNCCTKNHKDGTVSYYHNMLSAAIVHPGQKVVLPFAPEPIIKTDGKTKNDCEINAAKRLLSDLKREHPHLKLIVTGDGLFSNGPFINILKEDNHKFILVAKETNHKYLTDAFKYSEKTKYSSRRQNKVDEFEWSNNLPLNDAYSDCMVNVLKYIEKFDNGKSQKWLWVTNIEITKYNVEKIMIGGRARHKIENETFNTLKNQGYNFEHNYGHGYKNLTTIFAYLMTIAFFVDQLQQLGCKTFQKALKRLHTKKNLWEKKRGIFFNFIINKSEDLWNALAFGQNVILAPNTS